MLHVPRIAISANNSISHINSPTNANCYIYAGDNPITFSDPSGQACSVTWSPAGDPTFTNGLELGLTAQKVGTATTRFVRDPYGNLVGMLTSGGSHEYYITDRLGSVLALSNSAGTAEDATYSYDPYGNTTASGTVSVTNPFRYISGYQDASLRYHLGQREYNYSAAAFSQQDSISHINSPTNANRYVYAGDNPTNYTDPTGQFSLGSALKITAAVVGVGAAFATGGASLALTGAAIGLDIGGGIASGDSAGEIAGSAIVDSFGLGIAGAGAALGVEGGTAVAVGLLYGGISAGNTACNLAC